MNELELLLEILPFALTIAALALLLRRLADWNDGPSLASLVGGRHDLEWPRGVQEEEPIRWNLAAISPRARRSHQDRVAGLPELACPTPCHPHRQVAPLA